MFLLHRRLRDGFAYHVQGHFMWPAQWSMKNQRAMQSEPIADVLSRVSVGVRSVPASFAGIGMFLARVDRAAVMARFAGVGRSNRFDLNLGERRLVLDELLKLIERPIVSVLSCIRLCGLALLGANPNARQILNPNPCALLYRRRHDLFRDAMVHVLHDAPLAVFKFLHRAHLPGRLEFLPALREDSPHVPNTRSFPEHHWTVRRSGYSRDILTTIYANPPACIYRVGNFHRHGDAGIPLPSAGLPKLHRSRLGIAGEHRFKDRSMRGLVNLKRHALLDATQQAEAKRERVADFVQRPVLVVCFQRQRFELLDLRLGVRVTYRLIDPGRPDFHASERLRRERLPLGFRHRQNAVRNRSIQRFKPRKLACLDSIQAEERELQRLG